MRANKLEWIRQQAEQDITADEREAARCLLDSKRVAVFIVAYNAERHLDALIERIPRDLLPAFAEVFIIDDSSTDATFEVATSLQQRYRERCRLFSVYRTPFNRGYGGNQKLGYLYCIRQKYDIVILLHGDGQYPPEYLPRVLAAFDDAADAVFASRMIDKRLALKGGMPLYKWVGNQILTWAQNRLLGTALSEYHTGFRGYRVGSVARLPFIYDSDDFHFDTEIIVQGVAAQWRIREVAIPAYYGDEICHVQGVRYAHNCLAAIAKFHLVHLGLFYQRNFDFELFGLERYSYKRSPHSLHQYVLAGLTWTPDMVTIELGASAGHLSSEIASRVRCHTAVDLEKPRCAGDSVAVAMDLNTDFSRSFPPGAFDACVALDVIEHVDDPARFLSEAFTLLKSGGRLAVSTANVCYWLLRVAVFLGRFHYGKRGILDMSHKRLFTVGSLLKMLREAGFQPEVIRGFPPPLTDLISPNGTMRSLEALHARLSSAMPRLFAYNFLVVATRMDSVEEIFARTIGD